MPINVIERAMTPYNSSPNSLVNKEQYSVFAPGADIEKPGLAGFSAEFFAVAQQIVSLNKRFLKTLLRHKVFTPDMNPSGAKEVNTLYSSFTADVVIAFAPMDGSPRYAPRTGSLLVLDGSDKQIEILFTEDGVWTRRVTLPSYEVTDFLPLHNMPVNGADILYNTIGTAQLVNGCITVDKLSDSAVTTPKIADQNVTTPKLGNGAVSTAKIADQNVTSEKIADLSITKEKLGTRSVSAEKLATDSVTNEKIYPGAVTNEKMANASITAEKLCPGAVTNEKIYSGAVNESKLSSSVLNRLIGLERDAYTEVTYDSATGTLIFTTSSGNREQIDLPLELITSGGRYDEESQSLILILSNGNEIPIPLNELTREFVEYIDGVRESVFLVQKAPPLASISSAILLTTPTLGVVAALS